jgi:hypothetical protein
LPSSKRSKNLKATERLVAALVDALAIILIPLDITPGQLESMSRTSFVRAGAALARKKRSGRPHIARIAAITGLPRSEVRRIILGDCRHEETRPEHLPRALRVVAAWRTSDRYFRNGKSRTVKMSGRAPSFEALCKEYSGDIPHKAILTDLVSRNLVRLHKRDKQTYVSLFRPRASLNPEAVDTLAYVSSLLKSISLPDRILVRRRQKVLNPENLAASYFHNSVATRVASFVDDLPIQNRRAKCRPRRGQGLEVFAVVSRNTDAK